MISFAKAGVLLYRATRDGFTAKEFHDRCDDIPNTVVVIRNNLNFVFGGFTSTYYRWNSDGYYEEDPEAFIFSLRRNGAITNYKLRIESSDYAIYGDSSYGPTFGGGHDIYICDQSNIYPWSYSEIYSYTPPTYPSGSNSRTFLTGGFQNWRTTEIEVYQIFY